MISHTRALLFPLRSNRGHMAIEDVVSELNRLQAVGLIAEYAIGGAVAAQAYIAPMSTEDVDVFIVIPGDEATSLTPLRLIYPDLISHGAKLNGPYVEIGGWPVQFLATQEPLYADAISSARTMAFGGQSGRVMGPEHLAAIALNTGRAKDSLRLLEFLKTGALDATVFGGLIERFGLAEEWEQFQLKFMNQ